MPWPLVARRAVDRVVELLQAGPATGVALIGNEGVGKTTLAAQSAERLGRGEPLWAFGTMAQSMVPFGAFGPLLGVHDVDKPAEMISAAAEEILARAGSAPLIVDNARLLDPLSGSLVYRLAGECGCPLIVTVRSVLRVPRVVSALWDDGLLARYDLMPMDAGETAEVVAAAGGGDAAALYRRSSGNPLHLRLLMSSGGSDETLPVAIDRYLGGLSPQVHRVLSYLCIFEPLPRADLVALTDEASFEAAHDAGAVQLRSGSAYSGHPLFLERLATRLDKLEVQRLRSAVAAQLATTPSRTAADRMGRTLLALQGDGPLDTDAVVTAANEALRLGDLGLAERLAGGILDRGDDFGARLALSYALAWQGRGREAESVLAAVETPGLTEEQLMAWALPRAANQFWMLSEPERATIFLQNVRARIGTASSHLTLDALSATFAMNAGNVRRCVEVAEEVLNHPEAPGMAVALASSATALSSARMGRFATVGPAVDRALGSDYPGLLRFTIGMAEVTTLLMQARIDAAHEAARTFTDFAELAQPGRAIGEVLLAQVLLARGDAAAAVELLRPASATLERTGYSWGPLALTYLTTALAYQGDIAESAKALARAQSRHGTKSAIFAPELGIARAWRLATIGDRTAAITAARDAARTAKRSGQLAVAIRAWHEAVRLGDRRAAAALEPLVEAVPCEYGDLALAHAAALAAGDSAGLRSAAERLATAGFEGAAADAVGQAEEAAG